MAGNSWNSYKIYTILGLEGSFSTLYITVCQNKILVHLDVIVQILALITAILHTIYYLSMQYMLQCITLKWNKPNLQEQMGIRLTKYVIPTNGYLYNC